MGVDCKTPAVLAAPLFVQWVNPGAGGARESLRLFEYDAGTHGFTESVPGLSSGRAAFTQNPFAATIQGSPAMSLSGVAVVCHSLIAMGGTAAYESEPRLEFWRGARRLASVTKSGILRVPDVLEASPSDGSDRFALVSGGTVQAVISPIGLVANGVIEV